MFLRAQLHKVAVTLRPVSHLHAVSFIPCQRGCYTILINRELSGVSLPEADISCVVFNDSEDNVRLPRRLISHVKGERT